MTYDVIITLSYCIKNYVGLNIKQITFVKTQYENTNSKGDFVPVLNVHFKDLWYVKIKMSQIYIIFHYYYMAFLTKNFVIF